MPKASQTCVFLVSGSATDPCKLQAQVVALLQAVRCSWVPPDVLRYLSRDAISWRPAVGKSELLKQPSTSTPYQVPVLPTQLPLDSDLYRCPSNTSRSI